MTRAPADSRGSSQLAATLRDGWNERAWKRIAELLHDPTTQSSTSPPGME